MATTTAYNQAPGTFATQHLPEYWVRGAQLAKESADWLKPFEGAPASNAAIITRSELKKGGQKIHVPTEVGLYQDGVRGGEYMNNDKWETWQTGGFDVLLDFVRHGTRWDLTTEQGTGLQAELRSGKNKALGAWLGRKRTKDMLMFIRHNGHALNYIYGIGKSSTEEVRSDDIINFDGIGRLGQTLSNNGGFPATTKMGQNGESIDSFNFFAVGNALRAFKESAEYKSAQRDAGVRGAQNPLFRGGYVDIDGHSVITAPWMHHAGRGPIGSPMMPYAVLGEAIAPGTATFALKGGGLSSSVDDTKSKWFEDFLGYDYRWGTLSGQLLSPASATRYLLVYNLPSAATDPGKFGFYAYTTGNDGNNIDITARLDGTGAGDSGIRAGTVGNVTYNASPWTGRTTSTHGAGTSIVLQANSYGVPLGFSFMLGANAAVRAEGMFRNMRWEDRHEGGFVKDVGICDTFGQQLCSRPVDSLVPSMMGWWHAVQLPGIDFPEIPTT